MSLHGGKTTEVWAFVFCLPFLPDKDIRKRGPWKGLTEGENRTEIGMSRSLQEWEQRRQLHESR